MEQFYTLEEAKKLGDQAIFSIESENVLISVDGSRFIEVESNMWAKVKSEQALPNDVEIHNNEQVERAPFDNILYVSASHHDGGVIVRPLYVLFDEKWINISTGKRSVFTNDFYQGFEGKLVKIKQEQK